MKSLLSLVFVVLAMILTACGGGGGSPGANVLGGGTSAVTVPTTTTTATVGSVEIITSANSLPSSAGSILISAIVKDAGNVSLANQVISFTADSGNLAVPSFTTDANGVATASLSTGSNKANRNITVRVTSGSVASAVVIPVVGTQLQITGQGTLQAGSANSSYSVKLTDASGAGISNQTVILTSQLGNTIQGSGLTDPNGVASFQYTPNTAGSDTLSASSLGAASNFPVQISNVDFAAQSPAANTLVPVQTTQAITVRYLVGGVGQSGLTVNFSSTRGNLSAASATTNGSGQATVNISSASAGPASIVAQIAGVGQVVLPIQFIATNPSVISLQANPGSISPNTSGSVNQSALEAVVRDAVGNPVSGRQVNFNIIQDASSGSLSQPSAVSDVNGRASVQYIAGAISTPSNGVVVRAQIASTTIESTTSLTVSGQALFISIGFGNVISNFNQTTYEKEFTVYVTDANGAAVPNKTISLRAIPITFAKGSLDFVTSTTPARWRAFGVECPNEDTNLNGVVDSGEDIDGNSILYPGNVASLVSSSVVTNASGQSTFNLRYGENYVPWITLRLEARTTVGGTESIRSIVYALEGLASDFIDPAVSPAGRLSPFGQAFSCSDPN